MTSELKKNITANDLEYLDLEQAAVICSVSDERFGKWIGKGLVPVVEVNGKKLIHSHDLIQHLVRHNIPIPDRLLQGNSKKILFVLTDESVPHAVTTEVIWALYKLRKRTSYIFDFVHLDTNIELKIIAFHPDVIIVAPRGMELKASLASFKELSKLKGWEELPAVVRGEVIFTDGIKHFYNPTDGLVDSMAVLLSGIAGFESGYIAERDTFYRLRWLELHRHRL